MSERSIESLLDEIKEYKQAIEKIRTEIVEEIEDVGNGAYSDGLYKALEIINKHIGKGDEE